MPHSHLFLFKNNLRTLCGRNSPAPESRKRAMKKTSLRARLRYQFDKSMAGGTIALIGWLALVSLAIIIVAGSFVAATGIAPEGGEPLSFAEASWDSLMRT